MKVLMRSSGSSTDDRVIDVADCISQHEEFPILFLYSCLMLEMINNVFVAKLMIIR